MAGISAAETEDPTYGAAIRLTNGEVELLIPRNFGPRIMSYGFCGGINMLCAQAHLERKVGDGVWRAVGGHRFWHSPEVFPRTYMPDNDPMEIFQTRNGLRIIQKEEQWTQVQKAVELSLAPSGGRVEIIHKIKNGNAWDISLALWGITMMAPGGEEWIPQPDTDTGYLSNRHISLWPYTRMDDPRLDWGSRYIRLKQEPGIKTPCKLGLNNAAGWASYFNHGNMFIKGFVEAENVTYPDGGCSYETYVNEFMLEMESLSPLVVVKAGESAYHQEFWDLVPGVSAPGSEEEMDQIRTTQIERRC
ncbi:Hypothetical protein DEACI_3289 [Acididesulfobacillus acetoxydans]|uniref:PF14315 domain protein n=1 Tax=Acididesulfobacillus acetoxydans TaxID=1561005 RepID=A0A8S0X6K4_9FIRM|nr:hypothetical protein [Acididesulfobacillus acetoxydans]CAA7602610.1 Hypothetical protein DEACI_3289 [Acididesulfobacillus acetoxydans]CEJ07243.1 PF14315 domain protein [Acididesulfobacillus acetoxydans]